MRRGFLVYFQENSSYLLFDKMDISTKRSGNLMNIVERARAWARRVKRDALTLWFARSHPATPWYAKMMGAFVVAYALSPIDLIPDFIPVLGYLDDVILLPVLIWATVRLLPAQVLAESRQNAEQWIAKQGPKPRSLLGAIAIVLVWTAVAVALWLWLAPVGGRNATKG